MFTREALEQLVNNQPAFEQVQSEAAEANNPNHHQSKLKFAMCQIYGLGTPKEIIQGVDKLFDILIKEEKFWGNAKLLLKSIRQVCSTEELSDLFNYYTEIEARDKDPRTQVIIGFFYNHGISVPSDTLALRAQNQKTAVDWARKAAEQNCRSAQVQLGLCYEKGIGFPNDTSAEKEHNRQEAIKLYILAANQGDERAKQRLKAIQIQLLADERTKTSTLESELKKREAELTQTESASKRQKHTPETSIKKIASRRTSRSKTEKPVVSTLMFQRILAKEENPLYVLAQAAEEVSVALPHSNKIKREKFN